MMAWHVSTYHLDMGQLWRYPVSWCIQWKGTPKDCIDHIRARHHVGDSVKTANLWRWFPPWTVSRVTWHTALRTNVSGLSTDMMLFRENGARPVHHYRVFAELKSHLLLRGSYMSRLRHFAGRACADARLVAKRDRDPEATLDETSSQPSPCHHQPLQPDVELQTTILRHVKPCWPRRTWFDDESLLAAVVSAARHSVPPTPVLLSLPGFATRDSEPVDIADVSFMFLFTELGDRDRGLRHYGRFSSLSGVASR